MPPAAAQRLRRCIAPTAHSGKAAPTAKPISGKAAPTAAPLRSPQPSLPHKCGAWAQARTVNGRHAAPHSPAPCGSAYLAAVSFLGRCGSREIAAAGRKKSAAAIGAVVIGS